MVRMLKEAPLTTRNARAKLPEGLHWRGIDQQVHLGFRCGKRGGVWMVRWRHITGYRRDILGPADDEIGEGTLSYNAVVKAARDRVAQVPREKKAKAGGIVQTVRAAVTAYAASRDARDSAWSGRAIRSGPTHKLERYVIRGEARGSRKAVTAAPLAEVALHELDEARLVAWRKDLPGALKGTSRQRFINDLKAALNTKPASLHHRFAEAGEYCMGAVRLPISSTPFSAAI